MFLRLFAGALALGIVLSLWLFGFDALPWVTLAVVTFGLWLAFNRLPPRYPLALAVGLFAVFGLLAPPAFAAAIDVGQILAGSLQEVINGVVSALIVVAVGWLGYVIQSKFGIEIEAKHREALQAFVQRQAASLVAQGAVKLQGVKIEVGSEALAAAANAAIQFVPDALAKFGLTQDRVRDMIVDALPKVPSVAQAQGVAIDVANPATPSQPAA